MNRVRWTVFCLVLLGMGVAAAISPGAVAAAPSNAPLSVYQDRSDGPGVNERNFISVPGVFTLRLGQSSSMSDGSFRLNGTTVELPGINAAATVDGLTFSLGNGSFNWDAVTLMQSQPAGTQAFTLSDTRAVVQGRDTNFSTELSTHVDFHPNEATQAGATVTLQMDRLTGQTSLAMTDGNAQLVAGPATITVEGLDTDAGTLTVDSARVALPQEQTGVQVDGFTLTNGKASWDALAWYGREFNLGNAVKLSDSLVVVPGPGSVNAEAGGATTTIEVNLGNLGQTGGQLVVTTDPATGQPTVALRNGNVALGAGGWNVAMSGINAGQGSASVDTVTVSAEPLGVQAQVTGLATGANGVTFDQAAVLYLPSATPSNRPVAGFQLVIDSTDAGYVISTTTLVPTATASQP